MAKKKRDRPSMPPGYGVAGDTTGMLPWSCVQERLETARNYWVVSARSDGRPHVMPVWAVWMDRIVCFGTDRGSRKARNIASNPAVAVHLDNGDEPVIIEGSASELTDGRVLASINKAYERKYKMRLTDAPGDLVVFGIRPKVVLAWREKDFPRSATRWRFERS